MASGRFLDGCEEVESGMMKEGKKERKRREEKRREEGVERAVRGGIDIGSFRR